LSLRQAHDVAWPKRCGTMPQFADKQLKTSAPVQKC
jgi:hypothetical protein